MAKKSDKKSNNKIKPSKPLPPKKSDNKKVLLRDSDTK